MLDKLTVINEALVLTGNSQVTENDGTDEWQLADTAFGATLLELLSTWRWPFAITTKSLVKVGTNPSKRFRYAHQLPTQALYVRTVFREGADGKNTRIDAYEILGRTICCDLESGVAAEYVIEPADDIWHPAAVVALRKLLEAYIVLGFAEDDAGFKMRYDIAESFLLRVQAVTDSENPAKNAFRGSATVARATRRG